MHKANKRDLESDCVALLACIWEHRNGACDKCCPETRNGHDRHAEPCGRHTSRSKPKCAKCQERTCEKCSKEGGHERLDEQTYGGLARITGIPYETIRQMVQWFRKDPNHWALRNYGTKYGYVVRYVGKKVYPRRWHVRHVETDAGRHINVSVVLRGKTRRIGRFRSSEEAGAFIEYAENRIVSLERKILDVVYVGTMQDGDGKLFVEDVPEYHPARETTEIEDSRMESLEILDKASDHLSPSELATRIRRMAAEERMERLF